MVSSQTFAGSRSKILEVSEVVDAGQMSTSGFDVFSRSVFFGGSSVFFKFLSNGGRCCSFSFLFGSTSSGFFFFVVGGLFIFRGKNNGGSKKVWPHRKKQPLKTAVGFRGLLSESLDQKITASLTFLAQLYCGINLAVGIIPISSIRRGRKHFLFHVIYFLLLFQLIYLFYSFLFIFCSAFFLLRTV